MIARRVAKKRQAPSEKLVALGDLIIKNLHAIGFESDTILGGHSKSLNLSGYISIIHLYIRADYLMLILERPRPNEANINCEYTFREDGTVLLMIGTPGPRPRKKKLFESQEDAIRHFRTMLMREVQRIEANVSAMTQRLQKTRWPYARP